MQGHARSLKLLAAGKLKVQLNSDGEEEEEGETHAERLARIRSVAEVYLCYTSRDALVWQEVLGFRVEIYTHESIGGLCLCSRMSW